jgi:hypothetical protein
MSLDTISANINFKVSFDSALPRQSKQTDQPRPPDGMMQVEAIM